MGPLPFLLNEEGALDRGLLGFGVDEPSDGFRFVTLRAVGSSGELLATRLADPCR